jgi:hypothetical protein
MQTNCNGECGERHLTDITPFSYGSFSGPDRERTNLLERASVVGA